MSSPSDSPTARFRDQSAPVWNKLLAHPFPVGLASGTLAPETFRAYLSQNLLYLPDYARALAMGLYKSRDDAAMTAWAASIANIVDVEIPQNRALHRAVDSLCTDPEGPVQRTPATVAYTSWLQAVAAQGSALDIDVAVLPCAWSYGEIARERSSDLVEHPVYADWIRFFASTDYHDMVGRNRMAIDARLRQCPEQELDRLGEIFRMGCRMEEVFWSGAFHGVDWPDRMTP